MNFFWKKVTIGIFDNLEAVIEFLDPRWFRLSERVKNLLVGLVARPEEWVSLCKMTVLELTGYSWATTEEVYSAIFRHSGYLLVVEAGPVLRKSYMEQPDGEKVHVATERTVLQDGHLYIPVVEVVGGERWLSVQCADPDREWNGDEVFVFGILHKNNSTSIYRP